MAEGKNILYAASTFGHLKSFHLPYIQYLHDQGHHIWCAANGDPSAMPDFATCVELPFTKSYLSPKNFEAVRRTAALIRRERFDLVLVHTSLASFFVRLGVMLGRTGTARVINTVHGYLFDEESPLVKRTVLLGAEKLVAPVTDLVVTMNGCDAGIAVRHHLGHEPSAQVPGMGVPLEGLAPCSPRERAEARRELGLPEEGFVLLCAAEFSGRKNQSLLIDSLVRLPDDVCLALPGSGDLLEACKESAARLGLQDRVFFPGHVGDLAPWRRAADLCVSACRSEGLPFHVVEAMACGLPAVLSRVKGHEDLVEPDVNGLLYPYGDGGAYAECVRRLYDDRSALAAMGARAREAAMPYGLDRVMPQLCALYRP